MFLTGENLNISMDLGDTFSFSSAHVTIHTMRLKSDPPLNNPLTLEVLSKETKSSFFGPEIIKRTRKERGFCYKERLTKSNSNYERNNTKIIPGD